MVSIAAFPMSTRIPLSVQLAVALAAAAAPSLLVYNVAPSPTFLNQALACASWGAFVAVSAASGRWPGRWLSAPLWALAALAGAVCWSWAGQGLPASLALSAMGLLGGCALLLLSGAAAGERADPQSMFALFCWAWAGAGLLNMVVAGVQVFAPGLADGHLIGSTSIPGRAIGNLRQPNHLSSLLIWATLAVVGLLLLRKLAWTWAAALLATFVFGVVLSASRTGGVSVALLALWGLLDRRLPRQARWLLLATPVMYGLAWWGLSQWATLTQAAFGGEQRLAETDLSGSRFGIWANTWALIQQQPFFGVGFGNFNLAWTLTPFPGRPVAFFDHSHNLPLHLAAELGLPLAALVLALLLWAVGRGWMRAWRSSDTTQGAAQRCALMVVVMIGLHSLLEYPLWYAYFLLPAGWALGFGLAASNAALRGDASAPQSPAPASSRRPMGWVLAAAGGLQALGAVAAVADYRRVVVIYYASAPGPLTERIARGQRSLLFGHHGDYAAVTSGEPAPRVDPAFDRASHYLLDTRLMMAWARALAAQGDVDKARYLAARLREFRKHDAKDFFADCPAAARPLGAAAAGSVKGAGSAAATPFTSNFACESPALPMDWRQFLKTAR